MYLTHRFFYLFGGIILLFGVAFAVPVLYPIVLAIFTLAVALVVADAFLLYRRRPPVQATRTVASVWSLSDPNLVSIELKNDDRQWFRVNIVDELPFALQLRDFTLHTTLEAGAQKAVQHELIPLTRGVYAFGHLYLFVATRLGLLERRLKAAAPEDVAVYPSIIQMKRYELRAMRHIAHETGIKKMRRIGHSYEFEQIKNYIEGDDYRSINWKASGRHGTLMVNQYEDERSQQVYCVIDKSRAMRMPFEGLSLLDYAINTSLAISNIILKKQDKAGLFTFSDVMGATLKASRDTGQLRRILETLYREKERPVEANYELLYQAIRQLAGARSLLLLFTNFESRYALERALPLLRRLNRMHLLVVIFFENTEVRRLASQPVARTADIYRQTIAQQFLQDKKEMVIALQQYGIQAVLTKPQDLTLHTINKYLELKSRGLI